MLRAIQADIQDTTGARKPRKWKPQGGLDCGGGGVVTVQRKRRACIKAPRGEKTSSKQGTENYINITRIFNGKLFGERCCRYSMFEMCVQHLSGDIK